MALDSAQAPTPSARLRRRFTDRSALHMAYHIEVLGAPFPQPTRAALAGTLAEHLGLSALTADLLAGATPCVLDGVGTVDRLDGLTRKLSEQGFSLRLIEPGVNGQADPAELKEGDVGGGGVRDYYALLGVARSASVEEVRRAYHKRSKEYHPDRFQRSPRLAFHAEMQRVLNEAYAVLSDPARRATYDRDLAYQASRASAGGATGRLARAEEEFVIALGFVDQGDAAKALEALNKCLFLDPEHIEAELLLTALYVELGEYGRAREVAARLAARPKTRYEGLVALAQCDAEDPTTGQIVDAVRRCEEAVVLDPSRPTAHLVRARAMLVGGWPKRAAFYLRWAASKHSRHPDLLLALAYVYGQLNEFAAAVRTLREAAPHLAADTVQEAEADIHALLAQRGDEIRGVTKAHVETDQRGGGLGAGYWVAVVVGTLIPPHIWGVLALIFGVISTGYDAQQKNKLETQRAVKGVAPPALAESRMMTNVACPRCDFFEPRPAAGFGRCGRLRRVVPLEKPDGENPCRGLLFLNTRIAEGTHETLARDLTPKDAPTHRNART